MTFFLVTCCPLPSSERITSRSRSSVLLCCYSRQCPVS